MAFPYTNAVLIIYLLILLLFYTKCFEKWKLLKNKNQIGTNLFKIDRFSGGNWTTANILT